MFGSKDTYLDLAYDLRDRRDWKPAIIRELDYLCDPNVLAVEGTNGLVAVGMCTELGWRSIAISYHGI